MSSEGSSHEGVLTSLLNEMDGVQELVGVTILAATFFFRYVFLIGSRGKGLPPGPPTRPIIGNIDIFPTIQPHLVFEEWGESIVYYLHDVHLTQWLS